MTVAAETTAHHGRRRARFRLAAAAVAIVATLLLGGLARCNYQGDAGRHRVPAGGFDLALPNGWTKASTDDPSVWFRAEWQGLPGVPTAWLWLSRWTAGERSLDEELLRESIVAGGGEVLAIDDVEVDGRPGKAVRYQTPSKRALGWIPKPPLAVVAYYVEAFGHIYRLRLSSWPNPPADAKRVLASLRLFEAEGWRTVRNPEDGYSMQVPASWNTGDTKLVPGALLSVAAASEQPDSWAYVIGVAGDSVSTAVANARRNIEGAGGQILLQEPDALAGRPAARLEFLFPYSPPQPTGMTHNVEWFVESDRGGVLILAVGHMDPSSLIADEISERFVLLGEASGR